MLQRFNLFKIILGCIFLFSFSNNFGSNIFAEEFLEISLEEELKKGNFFIGLKQYLGGENDDFSISKNITFQTDNGYLNLYSLNGIKHKSKKINITWKDVSIKKPYVVKRIIFGPFGSYESAQKQADNLKEKGFEAIVAYPDNWEVWIPFKKNILNYDLKYEIFNQNINKRITPFLIGDYISQKLEGPIYITSDENIKINNVNFGKNFYLMKDSYGTWTLIQKIKFDDYLNGVLPHEIGSNSPLEALKAQAVIARTWGIYNAKRFNMDKFHLCVTTQCQVYKPSNSPNIKVKKAIRETSNLIITYKNKPINSFYHASNGGISAMASESWNISDKSYFNAKLDNSKSINNSFKLPMSNEFKLNQFLSIEKEKFYGSNHSRFRWEKTISSLMVRDYLIKNNFLKVHENISSLTVLERGPSGRVTKLKISTDSINKTIILAKDDIRRTLSFLPSNLFTINKLNDNLWLFSGGGFGHGVGLSQSAAIEMAELGFTYEQILDRYYQGTSIQKIETLSQ